MGQGQQAQTSLTRYARAPGDRLMELSETIAHRRETLGSILAELDRRRRDLFDVRKQLRQNAKPLLLVLGGIGCAVAVGIVLGARRRRYERRFTTRVSKATAALRRAMKDPDRVASPPPDLGKKVLIAVASGAASTLVTAVVKRWAETFIVKRPSREERYALAHRREPESILLPTRREVPRRQTRETMW